MVVLWLRAAVAVRGGGDGAAKMPVLLLYLFFEPLSQGTHASAILALLLNMGLEGGDVSAEEDAWA